MKPIIIATLLALIAATGCTQNVRARIYGGTAQVDLPKGRKLVTATWKDSNLWILTRPMRDGEPVESYELTESSSFGVLQGSVVLKEIK